MALVSLLLTGSTAHAQDFVRLSIGPELAIRPGRVKTTVRGEVCTGWERSRFFGALCGGGASKKLLPFQKLIDSSTVALLDSLVESDSELYGGLALEAVVFQWQFNLPGRPRVEQVALPGGPKVPPGAGISDRFERIGDISLGDTNGEPRTHGEWVLYFAPYLAGSILDFRPMFGIGGNNRLDRNYVSAEALAAARSERLMRYSFRLDVQTRDFYPVKNRPSRVFFIVVNESPNDETVQLKLASGSTAPAPRLSETTIRFGLAFDLLSR
jgi:hypothetical protein